MAVRQLKDGRWIVYYRNPDKPGSIRKEYFGRGTEAKLNAIQRNESLGLAVRRPPRIDARGPTFFDLSVVVEILSIRWQAVDWEQRWIRVVSAENGGPSVRQVPIHFKPPAWDCPGRTH